MKSKIEYSGKDVYVGIDVHKRTYSVSCICEGVVVTRATIPASISGLFLYLEKTFKGAKLHTAYEAGFSGFGLHRALMARGINNIVVNPASIEVSARDKVKTDRRDSLKIAVQLAASRLKAIRVPNEKQELSRLLTRTREQIVSERTRLGHQIKSKLYQFGMIPAEDARAVSEKYLEEYLSREMPAELRESIELLTKLWRLINDEVKSYRAKLYHQAKADSDHERVYQSVPGVGPIAARTLANELGDMSQFNNERQLFSILGLTPSEYSSGDNRRLGHISRQGSARLRWILVEVAWRAIRKDEKLAEDFRRISQKAGSKRAIVAIARKTAGRIRACFRKQEVYQLNYSSVAA